ncbi:MAG: hypothetical protein ABSG86_22875 [Thermoguttaceae bacterium]|jgi:hypothetical protein
MSTNLSNHFRQQRIVVGLRPGQVARLLGYRSVVGAANKIIRFEQTGDVDSWLFQKLAAVLFVDKATIKRLMEKDRRELVHRWNQWASQSIKPHIIAEILPGHYMVHYFPENVTTPDQMEKHASQVASDLHQRMWLVFSRKLSVYFDAGGHKRAVQEAAPGEATEPFRLLQQRKRRSIFTAHGDDIDIRSLRCPQKRGPRVGR